jgi:hypothetical protein
MHGAKVKIRSIYFAFFISIAITYINNKRHNFHSRTVHRDIVKVFYSPTDAQENCFKTNIKICIKDAPTCFGVITIIRERVI